MQYKLEEAAINDALLLQTTHGDGIAAKVWKVLERWLF